MSLWLVRAGGHGEHTQRFLDRDRVYLAWHQLNQDVAKVPSRQDLVELHDMFYPASLHNWLVDHAGQFWAFVHAIKGSDWVVVPLCRVSLHGSGDVRAITPIQSVN